LAFDIKKHNALTVLQTIREQKAISMQDITRLTGLSWGSVYSICHKFLEDGLLAEEEKIATVGRPPKLLKISSSKKLSLGIDVNSVGLSFHVVNLGGDSVYADFLPVLNNDKDSVLLLLEQKADEIVSLFPDIININISMQGKINRETGVSVRTNFFQNWQNVPLTEIFTQRFSLPTALYHDPDCLLTFHLHRDKRLAQAQNGMIVRIDEGIGFSHFVDGKLYLTGSPDSTCELGHTIVVPNGKRCICGRHGCLEAYASLRGMKTGYTDRTHIEIDDFLSVVHTPEAKDVMRQAADCLGIALSNLFSLYAPSFVMLDGMIFSRIPDFFRLVKLHTAKHFGADCNLLLANYHRDAAAIGASLLTINKNLDHIVFGAE